MEKLLEIDRWLLLLLNFDGGAICDDIFWAASRKLIWIPLYMLAIYLMYRKAGWRQTLLAVAMIALAVVLTDQIANIFKHYTPKFRPTHTEAIKEMVHTVRGYRGGLYGTVSAHAATTLSIALISASLISNRTYTAMILLWVVFVSYSRIYLGVHFPLDIIFGLLDGAVVSAVLIRFYKHIVTKYPKLFDDKKPV